MAEDTDKQGSGEGRKAPPKPPSIETAWNPAYKAYQVCPRCLPIISYALYREDRAEKKISEEGLVQIRIVGDSGCQYEGHAFNMEDDRWRPTMFFDDCLQWGFQGERRGWEQAAEFLMDRAVEAWRLNDVQSANLMKKLSVRIRAQGKAHRDNNEYFEWDGE